MLQLNYFLYVRHSKHSLYLGKIVSLFLWVPCICQQDSLKLVDFTRLSEYASATLKETKTNCVHSLSQRLCMHGQQLIVYIQCWRYWHHPYTCLLNAFRQLLEMIYNYLENFHTLPNSPQYLWKQSVLFSSTLHILWTRRMLPIVD